MNYSIRYFIFTITLIIITVASLQVLSQNKIISKILFKINDNHYSNIDLERRQKYIKIKNNLDFKEINDEIRKEILNDFISVSIFNEYANNYEINYVNLNNDVDDFYKINIENKFAKLSLQDINMLKKNIKIDLIRKKIIEDVLNSKKELLTEKTLSQDLLYNYNIKYIHFKKLDILDKEIDIITNRSEFLNFIKILDINKIDYFEKEEDIDDSQKLSDSIKSMIRDNLKIKKINNKEFLTLISIEKKLESYKGIFAKLLNYKSKEKLKNEDLNCNKLAKLENSIKEYEYEKLNNTIKENLTSINDYLLITEEGIYNYIFLCELRFDTEILNSINFNKKVKNIAEKLEIKFLKKYKKEFRYKSY